MLWAYEELGWGGYWMWDPVENAGLLPWFTATAFLHSVRVQEQRGMLRVWNVTLVIVTFFLTIFGTFMTRSGVVQSVHAFGEDRELALLFTIFMVLILTFSFGWVIYRLPLLRVAERARLVGLARGGVPRQQLDPALLGVLRPVRDDVPDVERGGDGRAADRGGAVLQPLDAADRPDAAGADRHRPAARVAQVDGVEPGLPVEMAACSRSSSRRWRSMPLGVRVWSSGMCFALCALVLTTIGQEFVRGAQVRREATGTDIVTALIGLVGRSKRRYGGYIVHVGIVLMFLGFAGEGFKQEEQALMKPGAAADRRRTSPSATTRCG